VIAEGVHVDTLKALPTLRTPPTATSCRATH
jgi:hypothetical protein